jgi:hypothetical protein
MKHPETEHEMDEDEHMDKADMLKEMHEHAMKHGPEHHADILDGMRKEHDEYEDMDDEDDEDGEEEEYSKEEPMEHPRMEGPDEKGPLDKEREAPMNIIIGFMKEKHKGKK